MRVIEPDFDRRIDLPGVGPCPRPVDIDQSVTGFSDLVSLRIYDFAEGATINGEAEGDEVLIVLLAGAVDIGVTGPHEADFRLEADGDWAIYLPPDHHYALTPIVPAMVAYARARPSVATAPRAFGPEEGTLVVDGTAERLRLRLSAPEGEADASFGLDESLERLVHVNAPGRLLHAGQGVTLGAMDTIVLAPGERALLSLGLNESTGGEVLAVAALSPRS